MHSSSLPIVLCAAGALAVPFNNRRSYVTDTDVHMVYVTEVVTVTAGVPQATPSAIHDSESNESSSDNWGGWGGWTSYWGGASTTTSVAEPTSTVEPITTSTPETTQQQTSEAAPAPTSTSTSSVDTRSRLVDPVSAGKTHTATPVASGSTPTSYADIALYAHNLHRQNHSAPNLVWSNNLAQSAQIIAESCVYAHNTSVMGGGYGQNIAAGVVPANISAVITDLFYNGEVNYFDGFYGMAQPPMTNFEFWGHFSQVVWKATTQLGCYTAHCPAGLGNVGGNVAPYFTVCNYKTPGNYANDYGMNIGAPIGMPTAQWNTGLNTNELPTGPSA